MIIIRNILAVVGSILLVALVGFSIAMAIPSVRKSFYSATGVVPQEEYEYEISNSAKLNDKITELEEKTTVLLDKQKELENKKQEMETQISDLNNNINTLNQELAEKQTEKAKIEEMLAEAQNTIDTQDANYQQLVADYAIANQNIATLNQNIEIMTQERQNIVNDFEKQIEDYQNQINDLNSQIDTLSDELANAQSETNNLITENNELRERINSLNAQIDTLQRINNSSSKDFGDLTVNYRGSISSLFFTFTDEDGETTNDGLMDNRNSQIWYNGDYLLSSIEYDTVTLPENLRKALSQTGEKYIEVIDEYYVSNDYESTYMTMHTGVRYDFADNCTLGEVQITLDGTEMTKDEFISQHTNGQDYHLTREFCYTLNDDNQISSFYIILKFYKVVA